MIFNARSLGFYLHMACRYEHTHTLPHKCIMHIPSQRTTVPRKPLSGSGVGRHLTTMRCLRTIRAIPVQIVAYSCAKGEKFKLQKNKNFKGHNTAGFACSVGYSPDGK